MEREEEIGREREMHRALLEGRPWATAALTEHLLRRLMPRLRREFPRLAGDPELEGCLLRALEEYFRRPEGVPEERVAAFLYGAARRDALNLLDGACRRREETAAQNGVAEEARTRKEEVEVAALGIVPWLPDGVPVELLQVELRQSVRMEDRALIPFVLAEEAPVEAQAAALGLSGLPPEELRRRLKRARDRILAALRRLRRRYGHA